MSKGIKVSEEGARLRLGDYAFLSALAYETPNITGYILPRWFTEQEAIDQDELVEAWRVDAGNKNVPIVSFTPDERILCQFNEETTHLNLFCCLQRLSNFLHSQIFQVLD